MNTLADLFLVLAIAAVFMGGIVLAELGRMAWQHLRKDKPHA